MALNASKSLVTRRGEVSDAHGAEGLQVPCRAQGEVGDAHGAEDLQVPCRAQGEVGDVALGRALACPVGSEPL